MCEWKLQGEEVFAGSKEHIEQPSTCSERSMKGANVFREWQVFRTQVGRRGSEGKAGKAGLGFEEPRLLGQLTPILPPPQSGCLTTVQAGTLL